jgi:NADPH:quinone reductase
MRSLFIGVGITGGAFAEYMVLPAAAAVPVPASTAGLNACRSGLNCSVAPRQKL